MRSEGAPRAVCRAGAADYALVTCKPQPYGSTDDASWTEHARAAPVHDDQLVRTRDVGQPRGRSAPCAHDHHAPCLLAAVQRAIRKVEREATGDDARRLIEGELPARALADRVACQRDTGERLGDPLTDMQPTIP